MGLGTRRDGPLPLRLLPFAAMAIIAAVDFSAGPSAGYLPLLALGPAFAGLFGGLRRTVSVGALALLLCVLLAGYNNVLGTRRTNLTFVSISGVTIAGMIAVVYRQRRERELADVRNIAEVAQRVLLRPMPRRVGPVRATVRYISAVAGARIGGDLYEVVQTPKGVRVIVGDVQGKGLDAVETAAAVLGAFREAAYDEDDLNGVADRIERTLARQLTSEQFVTAVLAELHDRDAVTVLNRGHPAPLIVRADGSIATLEPPEPAPPLGLSVLVEEPAPTTVSELVPGDQMLLYTDGVIEARNADGVFYPLVDRAGLLTVTDPEDALDGLQADLLDYVGTPLADDAAMLLLRRRV